MHAERNTKRSNEHLETEEKQSILVREKKTPLFFVYIHETDGSYIKGSHVKENANLQFGNSDALI